MGDLDLSDLDRISPKVAQRLTGFWKSIYEILKEIKEEQSR